VSNIHGLPTSGYGGSDRTEIDANCWRDIPLENKFGGWQPVNERHHIPISRGKPILSSILAVICGVILGAVGGWYLSELILWLIKV